VSEPDYKRPFDQEVFRGYFRWSKKLTSRLGGSLYHACHEDELREILMDGELRLRSKWSLKLPVHGLWSAPGTWTGLNFFHNGNMYGPLLISFPLSVLNSKHFMVFRRRGDDRHRYFFVQHEAPIPIYSFGKTTWRTVRPETYFDDGEDGLSLKPGAIYDIVITQALSLDKASVEAVNHPKCIPGKCGGMSQRQSREIARQIALEKFNQWMKTNTQYAKFLKRFPDIEGVEMELLDPRDL